MDTGQVYLDIYSLYLEVRRKKEDQGAQDEAGGRLRVKYTLGYLERALVVPFDVDLLVGVICATTVSAKNMQLLGKSCKGRGSTAIKRTNN